MNNLSSDTHTHTRRRNEMTRRHSVREKKKQQNVEFESTFPFATVKIDVRK